MDLVPAERAEVGVGRLEDAVRVGVDRPGGAEVVGNHVRPDRGAHGVGLGARDDEDVREDRAVLVEAQRAGVLTAEEAHVLVRVGVPRSRQGELEGALGDPEDLARAKQSHCVS